MQTRAPVAGDTQFAIRPVPGAYLGGSYCSGVLVDEAGAWLGHIHREIVEPVMVAGARVPAPEGWRDAIVRPVGRAPRRKIDGKKLAATRQALGLSQYDLAARSGVDQPSISRMETRFHYNITVETASALSWALKVPIDELLTAA